MKKKSKMKSKQKQKQKQKQSVVINIDNSRRSIKRDKKESQPKQQPTIIPQPIYVPQFNYAPPPQPQVPERQAFSEADRRFRQEPERRPVFNPLSSLQQINSSSEAVIPLTPAPLPERTFVSAQPAERKAFVSSAISPSRDTLTPSNPVNEKINNPSSRTPLGDSGYFYEDDTASEAALLDISMRNQQQPGGGEYIISNNPTGKKGRPARKQGQPEPIMLCQAIKPDGNQCTVRALPGKIYCGRHRTYGK
jgi:hypothetical protein